MNIFVLLLILWLPDSTDVHMVGVYRTLDQCIAQWEIVVKPLMNSVPEGTSVDGDCIVFTRGEAV